MNPDDTFYYQKRAEIELRRAQEAKHPAAVKAHYELAAAYLQLTYGDLLDACDLPGLYR